MQHTIITIVDTSVILHTERRREGKKYAFKQSEIKRLLELIRHAKWVEDKYLQK